MRARLAKTSVPVWSCALWLSVSVVDVVSAQNVKTTKLMDPPLFELILEGPAKPVAGKPFVIRATTRSLGKVHTSTKKKDYGKSYRYTMGRQKQHPGYYDGKVLLASQYNKDSVVTTVIKSAKKGGSDWNLEGSWTGFTGVHPAASSRPFLKAQPPKTRIRARRKGGGEERFEVRTAFVCEKLSTWFYTEATGERTEVTSPSPYMVVYRARVNFTKETLTRKTLSGPKPNIAYSSGDGYHDPTALYQKEGRDREEIVGYIKGK